MQNMAAATALSIVPHPPNALRMQSKEGKMVEGKRLLFLIGTSFALAWAAPAEAAKRVWVSGKGIDQSGCGPVTNPCRQIQYVLLNNVVDAGGEIDILDPTGFAPFTITGSVSIVNDGVGTASVQQPSAGQNAITINAQATDTVFLKGLNVEGLGVATVGIFMTSGGALGVVNCSIQHFSTGISIATSSGTTTFSVLNSFVANNSFFGLAFGPSSGATVAGIISQVNASRNQQAGASFGGNGGTVAVEVADSIFANNANGIINNAGSQVILGRTIATGNLIGVMIQGGAVSSYGDNKIDGNPSGNVNGGSLAAVAMR
jgi:hypothetical protein